LGSKNMSMHFRGVLVAVWYLFRSKAPTNVIEKNHTFPSLPEFLFKTLVTSPSVSTPT
jgi:hypothetical protein